jgi:hyperosmotically inducible protein
MKIQLATAGLLMGAFVLPLAGYAADKAPAATPPSTGESVAKPRSDQPVEDSVITTKVKALYVKDKEVSALDIGVKTVNGEVYLTGNAKSRLEIDKAVSIARGVTGVKSVKNDIQLASSATASTPRDKMSDKDRTATKPGRSAHPIDDTVITTKVKAQFIKDKGTRNAQIDVKTVNGVVELSGTADSKTQVSKAVSLARKVKGVKSVKNDVQVAAKQAANTAGSVQTAPSEASNMDKTKPQPSSTAKGGSGSNQPVEDTVITTKVKALMVKDKDVSAANVEVKTVNGVVHLSGAAKSRQEADKAVSIARGVSGVTSVKNEIKVQ